MNKFKIPVSVLVVIHTRDLQVLLLERADHPGYWQSVTGSTETGEELRQTARREIGEETGLHDGILFDWKMHAEYEIFPEWRHRYAPGVTTNVEHVFGLLLDAPVEVQLSAREHLAQKWLPWREAAEKVFSWSNRDAILRLPAMLAAQME